MAWYRRNRERYRAYTNKWRRDKRKNDPKYRARLLLYSREQYRKHHKKSLGYARRYALKKRFGLSISDYDLLAVAQNHHCAICGGRQRDYRNLAVDHDHRSGVVRGLLCDDCNQCLGKFRDDPERFSRAVEYLKRHQSD